MTEESKKLHSRLRTFASDLDKQRKEKGLETKTTEPKKEEPATIPKKSEVVIPEKKFKQGPKITVVTEPDKKPEKKVVDTKSGNEEIEISIPKIPAFHELQKQLASFNKEQETEPVSHPKASPTEHKVIKPIIHKSNKPVRTNIGFDATVITDTKSHSFQLFPSIIASIKGWFHALKVNRKKKSVPKYSVPETNRRKGVIQKATSQSGALFTADNETLREQIRKRRKHDKELELEETHESETSWSPFTEAGYNLLEAPEQIGDVTQNVVVEYKQFIVPEIQITEPTIETKKEIEEVQQVIEVPEDNRWSISNENVSEDISPVESAPEAETETYSLPVTETEPEPEPRVATPIIKSGKSSSQFLNVETNILTITLLIMVIGFVIILFVARVLTQESDNDTKSEAAINIPAQSVIKGAELITVTLPNKTNYELPSLVNSSIQSAPTGMVEISIVSSTGFEVTPSQLFEILQFKTLSNLRQSITAARFATINHSKPALVMSFVDEDTIRGGLLSWERTMASNLSGLYGITSEVTNKFTDDSINEIDVRILRQNNNIIIIYGIINGNTVLITSTVADFAQIVEYGFSH